MPVHHPPGQTARAAELPVSNVFFSTPLQRVGLARQRFFDEGTRPSGLVSDAVIQSWTRCVQQRRDPGEAIEFKPVTRSRIAQTLTRSRHLLEAGRDELLQLQTLLAGTACKAILTDAQCVVVHATETRREDGALMWLAGRVGVDLCEATVGTTAPGMVALTGQLSKVHGAEHFFSQNHALRCAAAPIHNAAGQLVAVLDLSCESRPFQFDASALVHMYATAIENRLLSHQAPQHLLLRFQTNAALLHTPLEGLAAVNEAGRVMWVNAVGRSLLQAPNDPAREAEVQACFGLKLAQLVALSRSEATVQHQLPNGLKLWLRFEPGPGAQRTQVPRPPLPVASPPPAPPPNATVEHAVPVDAEERLPESIDKTRLRDAHSRLITSTLAACGGNVSRAARELGVSRGLIYRHLHHSSGAH